MKNLMHLSMLVAVVLQTTSTTHAQPLHLAAAFKSYRADKNLLQQAKDTIASYYEDGAYEAEVTAQCAQALEYFTKYLAAPQSLISNYAIILDIDDTALTDYPLFKERNFEWSLESDVIPFRIAQKSVALKPVLKLSQQLKALGYTIIFLSGRRASITSATRSNLQREGFDVDELILLPMDLFEKKAKSGPWKASVRQALSTKYHIVGSVGDLESDFEGDHCGYKVKLPNYLY